MKVGGAVEHVKGGFIFNLVLQAHTHTNSYIERKMKGKFRAKLSVTAMPKEETPT